MGLEKEEMERLQEIINTNDPAKAKKKLLDVLDSDDITKGVKGQLRALLYGNAPFLGATDRTTGYLMALGLTAVVYLVILKFFALIVVASVAAGKELAGVDPNTLSCDSDGQIFLLLPHFTECHKYYMCAHGQEVEFTCPGNTIFDFEAQVCNWDWDTQCWLRSESDEIDGSGDEPDGSGDEPSIIDESGESSSIDIIPIVRPPTVEAVHGAILNCRTVESASQQVAYGGDCQRYWRCENGVPQAVYCSDGLYFNPTSRQCDYEANVQCHVPQEDELQGEFLVYK